MERGHIRGTRQRLPFYQEIEFLAAAAVPGANQVELTFVADDREMDVILEMDKKPGLFTEGSDSYRPFKVGLQRLPGHRLGRVPQPVALARSAASATGSDTATGS